MRAQLVGRSGEVVADPTESDMWRALGELDPGDQGRPAAALTNRDGWRISAYAGGYAFLEHPEGRVRGMPCVAPEKMIELWRLLREGDTDAVEREGWLPRRG